MERSAGSFKCGGRRCQVCLSIAETETYTSASTNQTYKINHKFKCNNGSFIYLLTCKICLCSMLEKQLISFVVDGIIIKVMTQSMELMSRVGKNTYFNNEDHTGFLENVFVTFTDKNDLQNPEKRENDWI